MSRIKEFVQEKPVRSTIIGASLLLAIGAGGKGIYNLLSKEDKQAYTAHWGPSAKLHIGTADIDKPGLTGIVSATPSTTTATRLPAQGTWFEDKDIVYQWLNINSKLSSTGKIRSESWILACSKKDFVGLDKGSKPLEDVVFTRQQVKDGKIVGFYQGTLDQYEIDAAITGDPATPASGASSSKFYSR